MATKPKQLSRKDLQTLQSALANLYSDVSHSTLSERTLRFAETILPDTFVSFDLFDENNYVEQVLWSNLDLQKPTAKNLEFYARHIHENPLHAEVALKKRLDPVILSDLIATEDFLETTVYKGFHSFVGAKFMMAVSLWILPDAMMTCIFWSDKQDFSERDRSMLASATPHLINAVRNAWNFDHLSSALEVKNSGILIIDGNGKIQLISEFVSQIWHKYFETAAIENEFLPETLNNWVMENKNLLNGKNSSNFQIKKQSGEINVRFVINDRKLETTLLFEEKRTISPDSLEVLNLTKREAEVLFWIAQGKSDKDIARLCNISPLTIHKHAQNIYVKLGVETRTAAMLRALEII